VGTSPLILSSSLNVTILLYHLTLITALDTVLLKNLQPLLSHLPEHKVILHISKPPSPFQIFRKIHIQKGYNFACHYMANHPLLRQQMRKIFSSYIHVNTVCKGKGKEIPLQARSGPEGGYRYSSTLPRPRHFKGVSGQQHVSATLYPQG